MKKYLLSLFACVLLVACNRTPAPLPHTTESGNSDVIRVTSLHANDKVSFPLRIEGEARGSWYFEATFPIEVTDANGVVLEKSYATALGDWMTAEFVPFSATLRAQPTTPTGYILLKYSNASGEKSRNDTLKIPVRFRL